MNNLLKFISKHYLIFIFLIIEFVSFGLIVQNNKYHKAAFLNSANFFTGSIHSMYKSVSVYFGLKEENEKLAAENAALKSKLEHIEYTLIPPYSINDSVSIDSLNYDTLVLNSRKKFNYIPALAISNSINKKLNYIYLNKGTKDGLYNDMGVVESNGIVGVIINCTKHYSLIMPVINEESSLSVKIKNQDYFGTLQWKQGLHQEANIIEVPNHVELIKGDTIVTSGYSQIFPQGLLVGFVKETNKIEGNSFLDIKIELSVDFAKLNHAYAIKNLEIEEFKNISIE